MKKITSKFRKVLSVFLVVLMVLSIAPSGVFAELDLFGFMTKAAYSNLSYNVGSAAQFNQAINVPAGTEVNITLTSDLMLTSKLNPIPRNVTVNLFMNNKTIAMDYEALGNGSEHFINYSYPAMNDYFGILTNNGNLNISGSGTIRMKQLTHFDIDTNRDNAIGRLCAIVNNADGILNIDAGITVEAYSAYCNSGRDGTNARYADVFLYSIAIYNEGIVNSSANINAGAFTGGVSCSEYNSYHYAFSYGIYGGTVNVNGGIIVSQALSGALFSTSTCQEYNHICNYAVGVYSDNAHISGNTIIETSTTSWQDMRSLDNWGDNISISAGVLYSGENYPFIDNSVDVYSSFKLADHATVGIPGASDPAFFFGFVTTLDECDIYYRRAYSVAGIPSDSNFSAMCGNQTSEMIWSTGIFGLYTDVASDSQSNCFICKETQELTDVSAYNQKASGNIAIERRTSYLIDGVPGCTSKMGTNSSNSKYSATAAVEYARRYALSYNKEWYFYAIGGDCANFVSQALYAGGYQFSDKWYSYDSGSVGYYRAESYNTFIRAHELMYYLADNGGVIIENPSPSDFSLGDAVFYDWECNGKIDHSAIVTAIDNGVPKVSCHSFGDDTLDTKLDETWTLGRSADYYLVKLNGNTCSNAYAKSYTHYRVKNSVSKSDINIMSSPGDGTVLGTGDINLKYNSGIRVVKEQDGWGYFNYYGKWGWIDLSLCEKIGTWEKIEVSHSMSGWKTKRLPTCSVYGLKINECTRCNYEQKQLIDKLPHNIVEATCISSAYCTSCSTTFDFAKGHNWGSETVISSPSCVEPGIKQYSCSRCNAKKQEEIEKTDHTWSNYIRVSEPTCIKNGIEERKCSVCYLTETRSIEKLAHNMQEIVVNSTCTVEGTTTSRCSRCGYTAYSDTSAALGHDYVSSVTVASCTQNGYTTYVCQRCNDTYTDSVSQWSELTDVFVENAPSDKIQEENGQYKYIQSAWGHDMSVSDVIDATCTDDGCVTSSCSRCDYSENTTTVKLGHDWGEWTKIDDATHGRICNRDESHKETMNHMYSDGIQTLAPDCETDGKIEYVCDICSDKKTEVIPAINHDYELNDEISVAPTCDSDGYNYYICKNDPAHIYSEKLSKFGHDMSDWTDYPPETGCGEGKKVSECKNEGCDYKEEEYYFLEHTYGEKTEIPGTCSIPSYSYVECEKCHETLIFAGEIDPDNHADYVTVVDAVAPTCTEDGYTGDSICERCSVVITNGTTIPALTHDMSEWAPNNDTTHSNECQRENCDYTETAACTFSEWKITKDATCTEKGEKERSCTECGYTESAEINATEHAWDDGVIDPESTCNTHGTKTYTCQNDASHTKTEEVALDENNHVGETYIKDNKDATCTEDGYTGDIYCADCDKKLTDGEVIPATGHDWGNWETVTPATCEADGLEKRICKNDASHVEENVLPAIGHDWDEGVIDPESTCNTHGTKTYTCQNDASHTKTEEVPLDENNHVGDTYIKDNKNATCTEDGYTGDTYCSDCDKKLESGEVIPALDHDMGEWYTVDEATCTEKGLEKRDCNRCDYYEERETAIDPDNHYAETFYTVDEKADCENDGKKSHHCERCDESLDEVVISAREHSYEDGVETTAPTCTEDGVKTFTCTNDETDEYKACTHSYTEVIPATGHDWGNWETVTAATCEADGLEKRICKNDASHVEENVLPAIGHDWDEGIIDPESTCNTHGTKTYTCQNDASHTKTEEVALDENNHVGEIYIKNNKDATCTEDGYTGDIYCSDCNKKLSDGNVIPALGHDMGEWYEVTKATCTEKGLEKRDCNRCDYYEERETEINPDNHYAETFYTVDEKADCENDGKKSHHCERCDESLDEVVIPAREHSYDNGVETTAPTCTEDGIKTFTCTNDETEEYKECTHSYTEVIPATGHDWGNWETVTPATCEADGLEKRICKNDASHVEENVLTAIGHDWDEGIIDPDSTCKVHGTKTYTCQNDASHIKTKEVPLDENNHVGDTYIKDNKNATCTEDGYTGDTYCADCDKKLENGEVIPATDHDWGEWETVKESTYDENGEEKRVCSKGDAEQTRPLPVLTRPSDENDNIETEKTVEYDSATGEAVIKLVASSKGEKITVNSRTPLDIVLVLDQSGSMEGDLLAKLKTATDDFTKAIYQDAVENGIDHRIAMVGFAMQNQYNFGSEYPQYLNTEILTTGGAPVKYNSLSNSKMNEVYKNALVSVNVDGTLNPVLTLAKDNLQAKGATAADLGLDMACQIFAQNENDGSRKRIVVFMTDGVPTYKSDYMEETATNATTKANLLKDAYEADLYSVGVLSGNNTSKAKTFLNNIASKDENNKALYFDCADAEKLVEDFKTIATQSTTVTTDFADITLIDTVSDAFTLTAVQENELRKNAIEKLGITNDDITVTRYADGTTEVKLEHINPVAVANGDEVNYVIDFSFSVTANEKALIAGSYGTNTDNAGVLIGTSDVYENNFAVPGATVENAEGVIYFTVNGITYHVVRVHKGDTPEAPEFTLDGEYTFSGWDIPDEVVFDGGKLTVDATLTQKEYTVTWNTAEGTMTDSYYAGDIIVVPETGLNANGEEFIGWNSAVPVTMPAENLEFTAMYGKHEHEYAEKVLIKVSCGVEGKVQYVCDCGDSYTETIPALAHKWATSATSSDGTETAYSHVYCENCGESPDKTLEYTIKGTTGWNNKVTYDLKLTDAENITIQPDGDITISLPVPQNMRNARNITIYREEADGTLTNLNGTVKNGYITFTTTHFSIYIIEAEYECVETGNHTDENADNICDICENEIPVEEPSENCNHYCHQSGFMNFLWKIFNFLYRIFGIEEKHFCECGAAHW